MPTFCVIGCDDSKAWDPLSFGDMFTSQLHVEGDEWLHVNIARGEPLPDMSSIAGIVLTGSRFNVRDQLPWYETLGAIIKEAADTGRLRVYGGCFGCQFICHVLGGRIGQNPEEKFVLKNEKITVNRNELAPLCCSVRCCCGGPDCCCSDFQLIESHGDCISELPPQAIPLATSPSCCHEMFIAGANKNILCCQAHPEFDLQYCIHDRIFPAVCKSGRLTEEEKQESLSSFEAYSPVDSARMMRIISEFLHL
ncbi:unnamed protein product [Ectocarpus fasciculatus]